jgi:hypothetical protein
LLFEPGPPWSRKQATVSSTGGVARRCIFPPVRMGADNRV